LEKVVDLKKHVCGAKPKRAPASPVVIVRKSLVLPHDSIKKYVSLCENEHLVLYHSGR
jgi:hypothetical protein